MWLKVLSAFGSIASILALPSLWIIYCKLYREIRVARTPKGVSEDCLEFLHGRIAINLVKLSNLQFLPRAGDIVLLPSERGQPGSGLYEVLDVCHSYTEDDEDTDTPCPARPIKIVARVKKKDS
jgi:hypothetical protein